MSKSTRSPAQKRADDKYSDKLKKQGVKQVKFNLSAAQDRKFERAAKTRGVTKTTLLKNYIEKL